MTFDPGWHGPNGGFYRTQREIYEHLRRLGYRPVEGQSWANSDAELRAMSAQWRLRQPDERPDSYDEIECALMEALVIQGGCQVWRGDGLGCAAQIVEAQAKRADRAQDEVKRLRGLLKDAGITIAENP